CATPDIPEVLRIPLAAECGVPPEYLVWHTSLRKHACSGVGETPNRRGKSAPRPQPRLADPVKLRDRRLKSGWEAARARPARRWSCPAALYRRASGRDRDRPATAAPGAGPEEDAVVHRHRGRPRRGRGGRAP